MALSDSSARTMDILVHDVGEKQDQVGAERVLVYILPGNPGLISFYEPFASALASLFSTRDLTQKATIRICGKSYRGFEIAIPKDSETSTGPFGLPETMSACEKDLQSFADPDPSRSPTKVILVGHSVGAYILLELLRRRSELKRVDIIGGILVFPTVTYIAKSRLGRIIAPILAPQWLPSFVGLVANALFSLMPFSLLYCLLRLFAWLPAPAATSFAQFLKSRNGVTQALWLGRDEMKTITDDKWKEDVWGSGLPDDPALYMYFGQNDLFVPNDARDQLILAHGKIPEQGSRQEPRAAIDTYKIPHSWCISHSDIVAAKLAPWIEATILGALKQ